jgi:hypothetical protein
MTTHQIHMAFVTGGSGLVGRHLFADLQARGIPVRALARSQVAREALQQAGVEPSEGYLTDPDELRRGMMGCDTVFHGAGKVGDWGRQCGGWCRRRSLVLFILFLTGVWVATSPFAMTTQPSRQPWIASTINAVTPGGVLLVGIPDYLALAPRELLREAQARLSRRRFSLTRSGPAAVRPGADCLGVWR